MTAQPTFTCERFWESGFHALWEIARPTDGIAWYVYQNKDPAVLYNTAFVGFRHPGLAPEGMLLWHASSLHNTPSLVAIFNEHLGPGAGTVGVVFADRYCRAFGHPQCHWSEDCQYDQWHKRILDPGTPAGERRFIPFELLISNASGHLRDKADAWL